MFSFHYNIELNEDGVPYINPVNGTEEELGLPEHKFMATEFVLGVIRSIIESNEVNPRKISPFEMSSLRNLYEELSNFSEIITPTITDRFKMVGLADKLINQDFDLAVLTEEERDNLNYNGIIYHDKILTRFEGLKVKVLQTGEIFELVGGIDNQHWIKK